MASGAEILWDLDAQGSADDQAFASDVFAASLGDDDANVYEAYGRDILSGLDLNFDVQQGAQYNVEYPDVLVSSATVIANISEAYRQVLLEFGLNSPPCLAFH